MEEAPYLLRLKEEWIQTYSDRKLRKFIYGDTPPLTHTQLGTRYLNYFILKRPKDLCVRTSQPLS